MFYKEYTQNTNWQSFCLGAILKESITLPEMLPQAADQSCGNVTSKDVQKGEQI